MKNMNEKQVENSKRWHEDAKKLVAEYDFDLDHVYRVSRPYDLHNQAPVDHCQFCGQMLWYVAIIKGKPKFADAKENLYRQIGCDCLELVLGERWHDFQKAMGQLKSLKDEAAKEARQKKYNEIYANEIKWLDAVIHSPLIENRQYNYQNYFIKDVYTTLTTGSKILSKGAESYLHSIMRDPRYQVSEAANIMNIVRCEAEKVRKLMVLIEQVDTNKIHTKLSSFDYVNTLLTNVITKNGATQGELDSLNRIFIRYRDEVERKTRKKIKLEDIKLA